MIKSLPLIGLTIQGKLIFFLHSILTVKRYIISGAMDLTIKVHSIDFDASFTPLTLAGHKDKIVSVNFSNDSSKVNRSYITIIIFLFRFIQFQEMVHFLFGNGLKLYQKIK
jgi:hypothetical protein